MTHPIVERLRRGDPDERRAACRAAVSDPAATFLLDALAEALGDPVVEVAREASEALARLARRVDGVPEVVRCALRSDDASRRWLAAVTSARIEPPGARLLAPAVEALASDRAEVRWSAARLLVETGRTQPEALPLALGLARSSEDPRVRRMAVFCIRELAPERPESERALLAACGDPVAFVRHAALTALAALSDPSPEVFSRLLGAVTDTADHASRRIAALALGSLGAEHRTLFRETAEEALRRLSDSDPDPALRRVVGGVLTRLESRIPPRERLGVSARKPGQTDATTRGGRGN